MDFEAIETALRTVIANASGVELACVLFENAPRPRHNGRLVLLSWVSIIGRGLDSAAWSYAENTDPLAEMTPSAGGTRELALQIAAEVYLDQRAGHTAAAVCERARSALSWPSSLEALQAVGLALATVGATTQADYRADGRMVSRRLFEARFNATDSQTDTAGRTSYIASADLTATVSYAGEIVSEFEQHIG